MPRSGLGLLPCTVGAYLLFGDATPLALPSFGVSVVAEALLQPVFESRDHVILGQDVLAGRPMPSQTAVRRFICHVQAMKVSQSHQDDGLTALPREIQGLRPVMHCLA